MDFFLLAIPMMVLASLAGGSLPGSSVFDRQIVLFHRWPVKFTWVPEALFCAVIASAAEQVWGLIFPDLKSLIALIAFVISYYGMQTATGPAIQWGDDPERGMARLRTLSPVVNWISDRLGFTRGDVNYCRTWMAVKGFLIGLPVGGIVLAVLWPLAYEVGHRVKNHMVSELLSGFAAAIALTAWVKIVHIVFQLAVGSA